MSCPYLDKCVDEYIKCKSCTHNEERSHYVEYHEYPSPTSVEWPYLPSGDDLRFPSSTVTSGLAVWDETVIKPRP